MSPTGQPGSDPPEVNSAPRNRILAALPADEYARLGPHLERVKLDIKRLLFDVDQPIEHVYFPESCVTSILSLMADGSAIETATVGMEGMIGLAIFHGTDRTSAQAFCQVAGEAIKMEAGAFREAIARPNTLTALLHRYTQALFTLIGQASACNRRHTMQQRCARWLLLTHDRVGPETGVNEFPLTHQFLSQMLGVRRATVTEALGGLQATGAISYEMGVITVRDRAKLEGAACECYAIIQREFDRLLDGPLASGAREQNPLAGLKTSDGGRTTIGDGAPSQSGGGEPSE